MYNKIGIIAIVLLFALTMAATALPMRQQETAIPAYNTSQVSPTGSLPDGNYIVEIHNGTATKVSYTPIPTPTSKLTSVPPTVLYDSQQVKTQQVKTRIDWLHILREIIDAIDNNFHPTSGSLPLL